MIWEIIIYIYVFKIFITRFLPKVTYYQLFITEFSIFTFLKPEPQRNTKKKIFFSRFTFEKSFLARILQSWNILCVCSTARVKKNRASRKCIPIRQECTRKPTTCAPLPSRTRSNAHDCPVLAFSRANDCEIERFPRFFLRFVAGPTLHFAESSARDFSWKRASDR